MEQKRVPFNVAKAIKEAGYPQTGNTFYVNDQLVCCPKYCELANAIVAPFATDVWLWLWREKGIYPDIAHYYNSDEVTIWDKKYNKIKSIDCMGKYHDPEEAIIAAIEYLVDNNLIK